MIALAIALLMPLIAAACLAFIIGMIITGSFAETAGVMIGVTIVVLFVGMWARAIRVEHRQRKQKRDNLAQREATLQSWYQEQGGDDGLLVTTPDALSSPDWF